MTRSKIISGVNRGILNAELDRFLETFRKANEKKFVSITQSSTYSGVVNGLHESTLDIIVVFEDNRQ